MRVAILTREPHGSSGRLAQAFTARGHDAELLGTTDVTLHTSGKQVLLRNGHRVLPTYDAVVARIGHSVTDHGAVVLRQFEAQATPTFPSAAALLASRDKLHTIQRLASAGVAVPETVYVRQLRDLRPGISWLGGAPLIIKVLMGTQGRGVLLMESERQAIAVAETLLSTGTPMLMQRFLAEARGRDIRAFVVGERVVGAARRTAQGDEYRSNVHLGAHAEACELPPEYEETALLAAQVLGLDVAGVDLLECKEGPVVVEVNSSPGIKGIEAVTGLDIAGTIVSLIEEKAG